LDVTEFLTWDSGDRSGRNWQLRDGMPEPLTINTVSHGSICAELGALIANHLHAAGSACHAVMYVGVVPGVRSADNARVPTSR